MASGFRVQFKDVEKLERAFKVSAKATFPKLKRVTLKAGKILQAQARKELRRTKTIHRGNAGGLISTISTQSIGPLAVEVGTNAPHAKVIEGPEQAVWTSPPPARPLLKYFMLKYHITEDEAWRVYKGWVKNKMPHMVKPRPYMQPARIAMELPIVRLYDKALDELLGLI